MYHALWIADLLLSYIPAAIIYSDPYEYLQYPEQEQPGTLGHQLRNAIITASSGAYEL